MNLKNVRQGLLHLLVASWQKPCEFLVLIMYARNSSSHRDAQREETCPQSKEIVNQVLNYFSDYKKHCAGRGALNRSSEATGSWVLFRCTFVEYYICVRISKQVVKTIQREANNGGPDVSCLAKWYRMTTDTFDHEAIRGCTSCTRRRKIRLSRSCW